MSAPAAAFGPALPVAGPRTLWLPLRAVRESWIAAAAVFVLYGLSGARDLSFYDSAELALVAVQGGLGHPLGQPLHTWLGWLFARLPGVSALLGLNLLSVTVSALTVIPLVSLAEGLMRTAPSPSSRFPPGSPPQPLASNPSAPDAAPEPEPEPAPRPWWRRDRVLLPAGVSLLFAHPALWENGTRVEVYALAMLCGVWAVARAAATLAPRRAGGAGWFGVGVGLGLTASANAYMATIAAAGLAPALLGALWRRRLGGWGLARAVGGGLAGLLPFLHLPLTAGRTDVFVWGAPTSGEALSRYLRNADFAHNRGLGLSGFIDHLGSWSLWAVDHGLLPLLALGLLAHGLWGRRAGLGRLWAPVALGLTVTVLCINVIFWPRVTDYLGYLSLPVSVLGAGAWVAVLRLARAPGIRRRLAGALAGLLAAVLLGSLALAPPAVHERTRHRDQLARVLAAGALRDAPPRAIVVVEADHWAFPLLYLQEVEKRRPDVVILPYGLSGASWYWAHLHRRHPALRRFALRGPGGRVGRFQRFRAANPDRPVLYATFALAVTLGRPGCPGRWLLRDRNACGHPGARGPDRLTEALGEQVDRIGAGSPPAGRVIAHVALERGLILWRYGLPAAALRAFRAGVPADHRPPPPRLNGGTAGRLRGPPHRWEKPVLIGHWSRNLYLAAKLLHAAGAEDAARAHLRAAAAAGLPEAK